MDQPGPEQGGQNPDAPGRAAEEGSGIGSGEQPNQEELRARLEEQLRQLRIEDLMVESAVSLLNLTARRIAKEDERDLEQGRVGIEAIRAWLDLLPAEASDQIRNALSELQMVYANAVEGGGGTAEPGEESAADQSPTQAPPQQGQPPRRGEPPRRPGEPPPRLWTPPGSS